MRRISLTDVLTMCKTDRVFETNQPDNLTCTCLRCGHSWQSDTVRMLLDAGMQVEAEQALAKAPPRRCAACKSPYYMMPPIRNKKVVKNGGSK